ncbi:hypothetical protein HY641_04545 [Candidatus Woesearchaeota archaeon]|nr:hypothetical protein [Candidatus Woesearchaeota archaeon]
MIRKCFECRVPMNLTKSHFRGLSFDAMQCPKCKEKVFTEEQATRVAEIFKAQRLKNEYRRDIITIGNSCGLTLPKDVVEAFDLKGKSVRVSPNMSKKRIELIVNE